MSNIETRYGYIADGLGLVYRDYTNYPGGQHLSPLFKGHGGPVASVKLTDEPSAVGPWRYFLSPEWGTVYTVPSDFKGDIEEFVADGREYPLALVEVGIEKA